VKEEMKEGGEGGRSREWDREKMVNRDDGGGAEKGGHGEGAR
jgi:hypothetical protein